MASSRVGKLSFKGDPAPATRKSSKNKKRSRSQHERTDGDDQDLPSHGWVQARKPSHLEGPVVLLFPGTYDPSSLYNPTDSNLAVLRSVDGKWNQEDARFEPDRYEPSDVHQVFVTHKLIGSSSGEDRWSMKCAEGRYLTADSLGNVTCDSEAVGPKEEWDPIFDPSTGMVAFQSVHGGYLTVDEPNEPRSTWTLHCRETESVGFCQLFWVKVQAQAIHAHGQNLLKLARRRLTDGIEESGQGLEIDTVRRYQSWGAGRVPVDLRDERGELVEAKKKGKLAETLLDRRATQKSDRYCK